MKKNADGTNRIIASGEHCLVPVANCLWKYRQDVKKHRVKTLSPKSQIL